MAATVELSWEAVERQARLVADRWRGGPGGMVTGHPLAISAVYGVPRGGVVPAVMVARHLGLPLTQTIDTSTLVVDDLVDSGETWARHVERSRYFDALVRKPHSPADAAPRATEVAGWVVFPWETDDEPSGPTANVVRLLEHLGEDPTREGLRDTPRRVVAAMVEMTSGYAVDPGKILAVTFDGGGYDEMVVVRRIPFVSLCEHHLLPIAGTATVAYVPRERIVGLSKVARLVECFARRLQVQERLTTDIADALVDHLDPVGVGVVVEAVHGCMTARGVGKAAPMVTSALRGAMRTDAAARAEFLSLAGSPCHHP